MARNLQAASRDSAATERIQLIWESDRVLTVSVAGLGDLLDRLAAAPTDEPMPAIVVDLDSAGERISTERLRSFPGVIVGFSDRVMSPQQARLSEAFTLTCAPGGPRAAPPTWVESSPEDVLTSVEAAPQAAAVASNVLALTARLGVPDGVVVESFAYSMMLAGAGFAEWRGSNPRRARTPPAEPVVVSREGDVLFVRLNDPSSHNAFSSAMRDGLTDALAIAEADPEIGRVDLRGMGASFCSGGHLDEFGLATDPVAAHVVRMRASAGLAVHRLRDRVRPVLHGACVGAGIEVPAFADHVVASTDAWFQLPELRLGLIPGAGGTVSISRRIGRWRCAWMILSGVPVDAGRALEWGLVDELGE